MISRRSLLWGTAAAGLGQLVLPRVARAAPAYDRKFLFIHALGGWDPTRVFATTFDDENVAMEPDAVLGEAAGLYFVDREQRPSVRTFFETNGANTLILNGVLVNAISHQTCDRILVTGDAGLGFRPDWASILGASAADRFLVPNLVASGLSFPDTLAGSTWRPGGQGQLDALLSGDTRLQNPDELGGPSAKMEALLDQEVLNRAEERVDAARTDHEAMLATSYANAVKGARSLMDGRGDLLFDCGSDTETQVGNVISLMSAGLVRCGTIRYPTVVKGLEWDSHSFNDLAQNMRFEALFQILLNTMNRLKAAPGSAGGTLADETCVVVLSEMGRNPLINDSEGKDHWPNTSAMLVGSGVAGGRTIGAYGTGLAMQPINMATGEADEGGSVLTSASLGATLLALGNVDPGEWVDSEPLMAALA